MSKTKAAVKKETLEALHGLVDLAKAGRLTPAQEDEAAARIKEMLAFGRTAISEAVEAMLSLQWNVGVSAIVSHWPELKPLVRKALLIALAQQKTNGAKRLRLSLARGIFAQDPEAAAKMTAEVCEEMRAEGPITGKDRMIFSNVLIGKGKPWLLHFPLAEWKPEQADAVLACAVDTCFGAPCAPFTQINLLQWAAEAGRLATLPEAMLAVVVKTVERWTPRFRKELKNAVAELPGPLADAVAAPVSGQRRAEKTEDAPPPERTQDRQLEPPENDPTPSAEREEMEDAEQRPAPAQYPPYVSHTQPSSPPPQQQQSRPTRRGANVSTGESAFDLTQALRQIEAHVTGLRRELRDAQTSLRNQQREERPAARGRSDRRGYRETAEPASSAELEELRRHNSQLEETATELRRQLEDLANDHEDHATAMGAHGGEPAPENEAEKLKALLGIKLRDLFAEFQTLRTEPADDVLRQHYGDMLAEVFEVLAKQDVPLSER